MEAENLQDIALQLGPHCEVIADFSVAAGGEVARGAGDDQPGLDSTVAQKRQTLLSMLKRRPCSLDDISAGLSLSCSEAEKYVAELQQRGLIQAESISGRVFFKSVS